MVSFAVVGFSVFAQGLTMAPLLRRIGEIRGKAGEAEAPARKG
jgi:NhaP-type Na+/H+ or K+/H+ antiporter